MSEFKPKITILELRAKYKMSQEEFAESVGVSKQTISAWEKNIKTISIPNLIKVCEKYNIKSSDLLGA